jgi:uncharacterized protein YajQ (UPF0234 family)
MTYATKEQIDALSSTHETTLKKEIIFDKSIEYISRSFGSGKAVLELQDKANWKIIGNITCPVNYGYHTATAKMIIFIKDNKYKIFLENVMQHGNATPNQVIPLLERDYEPVKECFTKIDNSHYSFLTNKDKKEEISIVGDDEFKLKAVLDIVQGKMIKRGISIKNIIFEKIEPSFEGTVRQKLKLQQGIPTEKAKEINKLIKEAKLKVQSQIQDEQLRVTGKKRDDLQEVIGLLRKTDLGLDFNFVNMRD